MSHPRLLLPVLLVAVAVAACADSGAPPPTAAPAVTNPMGVSPTTVAATTPPSSAATSTTTVTTTSTTGMATTTTGIATTVPPEAWHVPGRLYYFPIQPPHVSDYSATHHDYPATDIFGPEGSIVVAVTNGVIDEVSRTDVWDPNVNDPATRGGLYVSLVGRDGIRYYYSHLLSVAPLLEAGVEVRAGQLLGHLGRSGNAASTSPHVHFGISPPTSPGDWQTRRGTVAPYRYLQAWTNGEDLTPDLEG